MNSACYSFFDSKEYLVTFKQIFDKINLKEVGLYNEKDTIWHNEF